MAVRKIKIPDVDVKNSEAIILSSSRFSLTMDTSSSPENMIEDLPAPMNDDSREANISLHENDKATKEFHPLSMALPSMVKETTMASKFFLLDIFLKVGIIEPIRNYFISNWNSIVVSNGVQELIGTVSVSYIVVNHSNASVKQWFDKDLNVRLGEWNINLFRLLLFLCTGCMLDQDRNIMLVMKSKPNQHMIFNWIWAVESYELIEKKFDPGGNSFANVIPKVVLLVHLLLLTKAKRAFGYVWSSHLKKEYQSCFILSLRTKISFYAGDRGQVLNQIINLVVTFCYNVLKVFVNSNSEIELAVSTYDFDSLPFDWGDDYKLPNIPERDLVIYEMNVRAFIADESSCLDQNICGTYVGLIEIIPHLLELRINAVKLFLVLELDEFEFQRCSNPKDHMTNTWGYSTINFFALMSRYVSGGVVDASREFKDMVKAFHGAGIEVILDFVYNHTNETDDKHPYTTSFRGIDNKFIT